MPWCYPQMKAMQTGKEELKAKDEVLGEGCVAEGCCVAEEAGILT